MSILELVLLVVSVANVAAVSDPADTAALLGFRRTLEDPVGWLRNWKGDDPCFKEDTWEGVVCQADSNNVSHVVELRLLNHNLSGLLAPEIGNLTSLQILDLMWNDIAGTLPTSLGNLHALELLLLNGNMFTGKLPSELGNLKKLRRLQVDENFITGSVPPTFGNLTSIKHLHLNNNSLIGEIPTDLRRLPNLIHLLMENNNISGRLPPQLAEIKTLITLQLDNNPFVDATIPPEYLQMPALVKLSLKNCNLKGSIPEIGNSIPLQYLGLADNHLNGSLPDVLPVNLTVFDAANNVMTGNLTEFFLNSSIQTLILQNNMLSGTIPGNILELHSSSSTTNKLVLDLQHNNFNGVNSSLLTGSPDWFSFWLFGNPAICGSNLRFARACIPNSISSIDIAPHSANDLGSCQPESCNPGIDELVPLLASEGTCRCATAITVISRLKSPSFVMFTQYKNKFEQYLASGLNFTKEQVFVSSYTWEEQRLLLTVKLFPPVVAQSARKFTQAETRKLYDMFAGFKILDNPFFGPFELISFGSGISEPLKTKSGGMSRGMTVVIASVATASFIILLGIFLIIRKSRSKNFSKPGRKYEQFKVAGVKSFTAEEMSKATEDFSDTRIIGMGGYGNVYKGVLEDGSIVAIKRAREGSLQGSNEFQTEIELLSRIHHRNLVSLTGYCSDQNEQMLVYEYMSGGTLRERLSVLSEATAKKNLDFSSRVELALGAARGISYLHTEANPPIIHRDIKASNILIDDNNIAKVADFGLSKLAPAPQKDGSSGHVSTVVKGTPGYLDPEYFLTQKLTDKSDVYSFGVVILELITGMHAISQGKNLVREAHVAYDEGRALCIVDLNMGSYSCDALGALVKLGLSCCGVEMTKRPSMVEVVRNLEDILQMIPHQHHQLHHHHNNLPPPSSKLRYSSSSQIYDDTSSLYINAVDPR